MRGGLKFQGPSTPKALLPQLGPPLWSRVLTLAPVSLGSPSSLSSSGPDLAALAHPLGLLFSAFQVIGANLPGKQTQTRRGVNDGNCLNSQPHRSGAERLGAHLHFQAEGNRL